MPEMPPAHKPLTLIVATTTRLGIGRAGALPWPALKGEMAYFARVTKYIPPAAHTTPSKGDAQDTNAEGGGRRQNAVIMGRRTWESIPLRFRPLKGRVNVVVSGTLEEEVVRRGVGDVEGGLCVVRSLDAAVGMLRGRGDVERLFVIGGAGVYGEAMGRGDTRRVLMTRVLRPGYECDVFFPVDVEGAEGWRRAGEGELGEWTGEGERFVKEGARRVEGEVEYEFCMFERD